MSDQTIRVLIAGALLLHGLGHIGALGALIFHDKGYPTGQWLPARSWIFPTLDVSTAKWISSIFWVLSTIGFVVASMSFWGILVPGDIWRQLAIAFSIISALGILLFLGTWPLFNTFAALGMNVAIIIALLWLQWPPLAMFDK